MQTFKPSKILNIKSNCLGLTLDDLLGLMVFYTVFQLLFASIGLEILSIILTFFMALFLIPIRLKFRRGIIKDYASYVLRKSFKGSVFYENLY